ncbi:MAG: exodeoxyribonuclease VII large subunit [Clostridiales bacterium]|nr:exodeoxyribonuclease VII large subunit [Clostridiales bacterium]
MEWIRLNENRIYTVSDVNMYIKQVLDSDRALFDIYIKGEISNYKTYPSGHHYFTLKDEGGVLKSVMFRSDAQRLVFRPENGMKVIVRGRITVYPRDGQYQLYAKEMIADGVGALYIAFEQLKKKLEAKGYFSEDRKRPLPRYPRRICLITSSAGAAVRDMIRILKKRFPISEVNLLPVRVQGEEAPAEISDALDYANLYKLGDVIITGRGGGSIEDLWAFNDERVAMAIYRSAIPVVSAVGHEPDFTIADFVADLRAATPSNAAELVVPDIDELLVRLKNVEARMATLVDRTLRVSRQRLNALAERRVLQTPMQYVHDRRMQLDKVSGELASASQRYLSLRNERFGRLASTLDAISPLKVLGRGYAIATDDRGAVVKSADDVSTGTSLNIFLGKGSLSCTVTSVDPTYSLENRIADRITEDTSEHNSSIDQIKTTEDVDSAAPNQLKLDI